MLIFTDQFATAGVDYTSINGKQFVLNREKISFKIGVIMIHNEEFESNETFRGKLTLLSGERVTIDANSAIATIIDDKRKHKHYVTLISHT